jgi:hypothetical protein
MATLLIPCEGKARSRGSSTGLDYSTITWLEDDILSRVDPLDPQSLCLSALDPLQATSKQ